MTRDSDFKSSEMKKALKKAPELLPGIVFLVFYLLFQQQLFNASFQQLQSHLEIHVIDVGQGDSFLIVSPSGKKVLIDAGDTGKGASVVLPYLRNRGISALDYIIASHFHADHIGGIDEVVNGLGGMSKILIAAYDRGGSYSSKAFNEYVSAIGAKRQIILPGQTIYLGSNVIIKCIASSGYTESGLMYSGTDENALSVVLHLRYGHFDMYFGGDSNSLIEHHIAERAQDVDVYKVSHHGSYTSSTQILLNNIKPEVSAISVGDGNTYGHPHYETIARLININSYIYQTEMGWNAPPAGKGEVSNGSFLISTDGNCYTISGSFIVPKTRPADTYELEVYYLLKINAAIGGTTYPAPGEYKNKKDTTFEVVAIPYIHYFFTNWTGDISSTDNPLLITMNHDISITANFLRKIYPPLSAKGEMLLNRSLLQSEYINVISWEANPYNENIVGYRVYLKHGEQKIMLATLAASDMKFIHRRIEKNKVYTYLIVAFDNTMREGEPAVVEVQ